MLFEGIKQLRREAEIALHKIPGILRSVHPGEVEDEIRVLAVLVELFLR